MLRGKIEAGAVLDMVRRASWRRWHFGRDLYGVMRQALQTPRKELSRHKGRRCKGPEAERVSGEQGDRAAEVSSKGKKEAKQVGEREGQGDRQRQVTVGDLVWRLRRMEEERAHTWRKKVGKERTSTAVRMSGP